MKLVTFVADRPEERVGGVLSDGKIVDLLSAWVQIKDKLSLPNGPEEGMECCLSSMLHFLKKGDQAKALAKEILKHFETTRCEEGANGNGKVIFAPDQVKFLPPITQPGKIIAMGRNYSEHLKESQELWKEQGKEIKAPSIPVGFVKVRTTLIGHEEVILCPQHVRKLDYELELAIVIGKRGKNIPREKAFEHIAGYMIFNDVSARDVQMEEMQNQLLLLGKNFDTFGPMGPYLVLRDEVFDPQDLSMRLRVNGEIRQNSSTRYMIYKIVDLVEYWSQMTLEPGDIIASGTPSGVAFSRKTDQPPWFLKPGDRVEAEIEGLGLLRNRVQMAP
jgi:2-keto-4-pentenoate hydratase/2-oxohepta-3-ene-1,7-dioic acid hydratase in catechol pathway